MKHLIDGYNLLHASGVFGRPEDEPTLENARRALLDFLASHLSEKERGRTAIVFDGKDAPRGLPAHGAHEGMQIHFSRRQQTADELIADMIEGEPQPRELLVVSSDHGVQRSARQRGISYQDSEEWIRERRQSQPTPTIRADKPVQPESLAEQQHWLREFTSPPAKQQP